MALTPEQIEEAGKLLDREASKDDSEVEAADEGNEPSTEEELSDAEVVKRFRDGKLLTDDQANAQTNEAVQKRLARKDRQSQDAAQKAREEAEAESLKEKEEFRELSEKLQKKLEQEQAKTQESEGRYQRVLKGHALEKAFTSEDAKAERVPFLIKQVDMDAVEIDEDGNVKGAQAQAKSLKKELPELFSPKETPQEESPAPKRPVPPSPRPATSDQEARQREEAAKEQASRQYQNTF